MCELKQVLFAQMLRHALHVYANRLHIINCYHVFSSQHIYLKIYLPKKLLSPVTAESLRIWRRVARYKYNPRTVCITSGDRKNNHNVKPISSPFNLKDRN